MGVIEVTLTREIIPPVCNGNVTPKIQHNFLSRITFNNLLNNTHSVNNNVRIFYLTLTK